LPGFSVTNVKRSDTAKGLEVLPRRYPRFRVRKRVEKQWRGGERILASLNRCRRLAKDFQNLTARVVAFVSLASMRLMLRKLSNPA
jgi:transposase